MKTSVVRLCVEFTRTGAIKSYTTTLSNDIMLQENLYSKSWFYAVAKRMPRIHFLKPILN